MNLKTVNIMFKSPKLKDIVLMDYEFSKIYKENEPSKILNMTA